MIVVNIYLCVTLSTPSPSDDGFRAIQPPEDMEGLLGGDPCIAVLPVSLLEDIELETSARLVSAAGTLNLWVGSWAHMHDSVREVDEAQSFHGGDDMVARQ